MIDKIEDIEVTDEMVIRAKDKIPIIKFPTDYEIKQAIQSAIEASEEIQDLIKQNEILQKQIRILETGGDNIVNDINEALCFLSKYAK